ncbi:MAG TPA: IS21 family transposase [Flavihumibacter sp.]|nr:IS21 family transposase [Flavihumibacter sp.]
MSKIRQVLRCYAGGTGTKKTSQLTGVSRNVVKSYLRRFVDLRISIEEMEVLDDLALQQLFFPVKKEPAVADEGRRQRLQALLPGIVKALRRKGMTLEHQWQAYIKTDPGGYGRTQFYVYLTDYRRQSGLTMHLEHKAGEKMFVDFCGDKLSMVDISTGEIRPVEVFVAILGCSQLTYVEAVFTQQKEDFILCCANAFLFYGGVTAAVVPDNLKAAVTRSSKYEPVLNATFESFAEHYNTVILPARAYKPKDKALVENAVKLVYQRIYTALAEQVFTSLAELNTAIRGALEQHNNAPLKQGDSRRMLFEQEEKQALYPLPSVAFELRRFRENRVMKNGYVALYEDRHYYSVPYQYIGKKVRLSYTSGQVDIYYQFDLIARHQRSYRRNRHTTQADHLASKHRYLTDWNPEYFSARGKAISEEVGLFMEKLMEAKAHPEQGYKACNGVLNLARRVGTERITIACRRALEYGAIHYYILEDILKKGLDQLSPEELQQQPPATPTHDNLRGAAYYEQTALALKNKQP